jgi:ribosomal protein S14
LTQAGPNPKSAGRRTLACARCGAEFTCNLHGPCWCSEETVRLPLPTPTGPTGFDDCLCRDCLRALATAGAPLER